jgi:hypothetical protein
MPVTVACPTTLACPDVKEHAAVREASHGERLTEEVSIRHEACIGAGEAGPRLLHVRRQLKAQMVLHSLSQFSVCGSHVEATKRVSGKRCRQRSSAPDVFPDSGSLRQSSRFSTRAGTKLDLPTRA